MTDFYHFPAYVNSKQLTPAQQLAYIRGEVGEALEAYLIYSMSHSDEAKREFGLELMDIIHATETLMRMCFCDGEVQELHELCVSKNKRRGYYS